MSADKSRIGTETVKDRLLDGYVRGNVFIFNPNVPESSMNEYGRNNNTFRLDDIVVDKKIKGKVAVEIVWVDKFGNALDGRPVHLPIKEILDSHGYLPIHRLDTSGYKRD